MVNALRVFINLKSGVYLKNILNIQDIVYKVFVYSFPMFRFFDFASGIVLCDIFLKYHSIISEKINFFVLSVLECISIASLLTSPIFFKEPSAIFARIFFYNLMIFVFAMDKGLIAKLFSTEVAKTLGNISLYFYLFHYPLVCLPLYCSPKIVGFILSSSKYQSILYTLLLYIILFIATITLFLAYNAAINKFFPGRRTKTLDATNSIKE